MAGQHRPGAYYWLAAYTGARRGELLHPPLANMEDAAETTVVGSTDVIDGARHDGDTKGGRSRVVSIDDETVEVLRGHRKRQAVEQLAVGRTGEAATTWSSRPPTARPFTPTRSPRSWGTLVRRSGLPASRLHDLRHLHATTLLLAGVPVHVVAARFGHADPDITLRVYAHVLREQAAVSRTCLRTRLRPLTECWCSQGS
jgi:integrase